MGNNNSKNKLLGNIDKNSLKNEQNTFSNANSDKIGLSENGLMQCKFCGRSFAMDRILKHQNICRNIKHKPDSIEQNIKLRDNKDEWGNKIKDEK